MLLFTSLAIIGTTQNTNANDITASKTGLMIVAFVAVAFCSLGAFILSFYNEKKIMKIIAKPEEGEILPQEDAVAEAAYDENAPIETEEAPAAAELSDDKGE